MPKVRSSRLQSVAAGLALALCSLSAQAHLVETGLGPIYDGIAHFALSPEDVIPVIAMALLAGLRGKAHSRLVLFVLPIAWLLGGLVSAALQIAVYGAWSWAPLLLLGAMIAADISLSTLATAILAALVGVAEGAANATALAAAGGSLLSLLGAAASVFVAVALVSAFVLSWRWRWARVAGRVAGSWIAASGLLLLGWSLR